MRFMIISHKQNGSIKQETTLKGEHPLQATGNDSEQEVKDENYKSLSFFSVLYFFSGFLHHSRRSLSARGSSSFYDSGFS